jgi:hypothetical protein
MKPSRKLVLCTLLFFFSISSAATGQDIKTVDWPKLRIVFESYVNYPTSVNAATVIVLLPKNAHVKFTNQAQEQDTLNFISSADQIRMLERQVISGDREAIRLAFNLFAVADGAFAEDLCIMLGSLIRINPKLFLEELNEFQGLTLPIHALVGNVGYMYIDRMKARCYEEQLRIDSLSKVKEPKLNSLRDRCIESLREGLKSYCKEE